MCSSCGGACGLFAPRARRRTTIDVNQGGRRLRIVDAGGPTPLFVSRPLALEHGAALAAWAKRVGFADVFDPSEMHVTLAYSLTPVDWFAFASWRSGDDVDVPAGGPRRVEAFGPQNDAIVLRFASDDFSRRWQEFKDGGCSWSWPTFAPHVTIAGGRGSADIARLRAYVGLLTFGPETFAPIDAV